jgi:hypothetical protein
MKHSIFFISCLVCFSLLISCNSHKGQAAHLHDSDVEHLHTEQQNNYFGDYNLKDNSYGTNTAVTIKGDTRKMVTNALPDHKTGDFPNQGNPNTISAQDRTYTFPLSPKYTGKAEWIREPGVALNGVKFEPGTAEVVTCDTGENYRVEAFQDVIDLGLDFNHAHVQPTGAYHYHGSPTSVIDNFDTGEDLVHIGFAHDGFPMYYSKSAAYKPSYKLLDGTRDGEDCNYENPHNSMDISVGGHHDGTYGSDFEYVEGSGDLDECNGITIDGNYMYLVTNEFPYVSRCLMGEVAQDRSQQLGMQGGQGQQRGRPNLHQIFSEMDSNKDGKLSKIEVKGPLSRDFSKLDNNSDGFITKQELEKVSRNNKRDPQNERLKGQRN